MFFGTNTNSSVFGSLDQLFLTLFGSLCLMYIRVYGGKILSRGSIVTVFGFYPQNVYEEQSKRTWDSCFPCSVLKTSFLSLMLPQNMLYVLLVFLLPFSLPPFLLSIFSLYLISLFSCCYKNDLIVISGLA